MPPPYIFGPFTGITSLAMDDYEHTSAHFDGYWFFEDETLPELGIGEEHEVRVTCYHELAGNGFSGNLNYRVWIDWNQDGDFEDVDEEVMSVDEAYYTETQSTTFTVPSHALDGETRMRVYNDMPVGEGHDYPSPCGYLTSTNPIGHHGEAEDYILVIGSGGNGSGGGSGTDPADWPIGISNISTSVAMQSIVRGNQIEVSLSSPTAIDGTLSIYSITGQHLHSEKVTLGSNQTKKVSITDLSSGIYVVKLDSKGYPRTEKVIVQ
ncbi:MAG: T9SS type A sorting domain-containing protein [Flavobacteriales bacterium]|nr:T9SS type A sorting domain-containing protein [Flavobacteriales bacterium]